MSASRLEEGQSPDAFPLARARPRVRARKNVRFRQGTQYPGRSKLPSRTGGRWRPRTIDESWRKTSPRSSGTSTRRALQAKEAEDTLSFLKASEAEAVGRPPSPDRSSGRPEQRHAQLLGALQEAERAEAEQTFREAVAARDRMADEVAEAIAAAMTAIADLQHARAAIEHALNAGAAVGARNPEGAAGRAAGARRGVVTPGATRAPGGDSAARERSR